MENLERLREQLEAMYGERLKPEKLERVFNLFRKFDERNWIYLSAIIAASVVFDHLGYTLDFLEEATRDEQTYKHAQVPLLTETFKMKLKGRALLGNPSVILAHFPNLGGVAPST